MTFNRTLNRSAYWLPWLGLLFLLAGCRQEPPASGLPTVQMKLGNQTFTLEVARTEETRAFGLMRRDSMPEDHGMIFVFDRAMVLPFYMKNTRIPLDIVFIGETGNVVAIKQMKPYDLTTVSSDVPAKWAVELNQGTAAEAGIKVGDKVDIPESARSAAP